MINGPKFSRRFIKVMSPLSKNEKQNRAEQGGVERNKILPKNRTRKQRPSDAKSVAKAIIYIIDEMKRAS